MKNLLVPVDFSKASHNAAKYAVQLAQSFDATITLINVAAPGIMADDSVLASVIITQAEILDIHQNFMNKEIECFSKDYPSKVFGLVREGYVSEAIAKMAEAGHTDFIIMGMKGKGKSNSVFGSTTVAVIRKSSLPVFVIPETASYQAINTITFATDLDIRTEEECFEPLIELAKKYQSFIQILNVQKDERKISDKEFIHKMRTYLTFDQTKNTFNTIENKNIIKGINKFIEKNECDVLAMMAQKHSGFAGMIGRAYTKEMSYAIKIPLLILQNK
ncbi:MAG: universal stress protein [Ginsengibacter sp.]